MHPLIQLVLRAMTALAVAYHTIWACAPSAHLPPPLPNVAGEMSFGGTVLGGSSAPLSEVPSLDEMKGYGEAQAWGSYALTDRWNLTGTAYIGVVSLLGGGVNARFDIVETDRVQLGVQAGGGFIYATAGVPFSVGVTDSLTLYTLPSVTTSAGNRESVIDLPITPQVPLGLWWTSPTGVGAGVELGAVVYPDGRELHSLPYVALSMGYSPSL